MCFDTLFSLCWIAVTTHKSNYLFLCVCSFMLCACLFQFSIVIQSDFHIEFSSPFGINSLFFIRSRSHSFCHWHLLKRWKIPHSKVNGESHIRSQSNDGDDGDKYWSVSAYKLVALSLSLISSSELRYTTENRFNCTRPIYWINGINFDGQTCESHVSVTAPAIFDCTFHICVCIRFVCLA